MKVKELIEMLKGCDPDAIIFVNTECEGYGEANAIRVNPGNQVWVGDKDR